MPPPLVLVRLYSKHSVRDLIATVVYRQIFRVGSLGPKLFRVFAIEVCDRPKVFELTFTLDQVGLSETLSIFSELVLLWNSVIVMPSLDPWLSRSVIEFF